MGNMTQIDLVALKRYATELENFKAGVIKYCNDLETGINSCSKYMQDEPSKRALAKSYQVAEDIKKCVEQTQRTLDRVYMMIRVIESSNEYESM